jgi:DNA modification methylase
MPFKYHPPTREHCHVCEELTQARAKSPIIDSHNGKASSAGNFSIHNWYYFVLGYSPEFPDYILKKYGGDQDSFIVDPFMGTGTTLVACKSKGIPSGGVDANDFFVDVANTKLNWAIDLKIVKEVRDSLFRKILDQYSLFDFSNGNGHKPIEGTQIALFESKEKYAESIQDYAARHRMEMLDPRYISDKPFARWNLIKELIHNDIPDGEVKRFYNLAIASILVPSSNVRYGPGFGLIKPKDDIDVYSLFRNKVDQMISDLERVTDTQRNTSTRVIKGDSRQISSYFEPNSVDMMITSPPYPGDHEYTKHTRLELIAMDYAKDLEEFRVIKKRMLRGSTTNIYSKDNDRENVKHIQDIKKITELIDERLKMDGATSGFEKLYTKLVWEYFGGMSLALKEAHKVLKPGGTFHLLVSDSHAFKMVHIQTAKLLADIGLDVGYNDVRIELWQDKVSTSHRYDLKENILTLVK